jgi:hypothetical protein
MKTIKLSTTQLRSLIKEALLNELMPDPSRIDSMVSSEVSSEEIGRLGKSVANAVIKAVAPRAMGLIANHMTKSGVGGAGISRFKSSDVGDLLISSELTPSIEEEFIESFNVIFEDYVKSLARATAEELYKA